jgi:hypothetical protein
VWTDASESGALGGPEVLARGLLGASEGVLGPAQEHGSVVLISQLDEAGVEPDAVSVVDAPADGELEPPMEALGVRVPRFGHDHREATVSEVGRDVGTADGALDPLTGGEEVVQTSLGLE